MRPIRQSPPVSRERFLAEIVPAAEPVVFRALAADWPAVRSGDPLGYLAPMARAVEAEALVARDPSLRRFTYAPGMDGFTFAREKTTLPEFFDRLRALADDAEAPAMAMQSVAPEIVPGFAASHPLALAPDGVRPRLWVGNRAVTALHHDLMSNLAVVVAGRRRFVLIPPERTPDLYPGPFEHTPAGTPVSMVDPDAPDLLHFPRAAAAMAEAMETELAPGDAIYIPYMWWHQVEALDPVSALANFWWTQGTPPLPGLAPVDALIHTLLALRGCDAEQKRAWHAMFEAYAFSAPDHIPPARRGVLGALDERQVRSLAAQLGALMRSNARS